MSQLPRTRLRSLTDRARSSCACWYTADRPRPAHQGSASRSGCRTSPADRTRSSNAIISTFGDPGAVDLRGLGLFVSEAHGGQGVAALSRAYEPSAGSAASSRLQLSECLAGVGDSLGVDVAGRSPVGDFLPVSPGEYPLDREHLGGPQSCLDARAQGARQCLLVVEHVPRESSRQARCGEHPPMKRPHRGMAVEAGDGVVTVETSPEMPVQRGHRRDTGLEVTYDSRGLTLVIREA